MIWREPKTNWADEDFVNTEDWNRVEGNLEYVSSFDGIGYTPKAWTVSDFPTVSRINRIKSGINELAGRISAQPLEISTQNLQKFGCGDMNQLESYLLRLYERTKQLELGTVRAGPTVAGREINLPIGGI